MAEPAVLPLCAQGRLRRLAQAVIYFGGRRVVAPFACETVEG